MDGPLADCKRSLLDGLRPGRMRVAGAREIFRTAAKLHENAGFMDHFAGFSADNVHAEHAIGLRICENLHEAVGGLVDLGAAIGGKREFADGIGHAGLLQFFLGLAFCWGALMGWSGQFGTLAPAAFLLYGASIAWTIGYDTIYAHQDKEDDELVGVRSTARLFGDNTRTWLIGLYGLALVLMVMSFASAGVGLLAYAGVAAAAGMFIRQIIVLDINDGDQCLALFKSNTRVGALVFAGLLLPLAVNLLQ